MYTFMEFSRYISLPTHDNDFCYFVDREFLYIPIYIYIHNRDMFYFFPVHSVLCRTDGMK